MENIGVGVHDLFNPCGDQLEVGCIPDHADLGFGGEVKKHLEVVLSEVGKGVNDVKGMISRESSRFGSVGECGALHVEHMSSQGTKFKF